MPRDIVVAATGVTFTDFAPCVPAVEDDGTVCFQARTGDLTGVFTGDGGPPGVVLHEPRWEVVSHPVRADGRVACYARFAGGPVGLWRDGAAVPTPGEVAEVGPLGPTTNRRGDVAFRARLRSGQEAVLVAWADGRVEVLLRADEVRGLPVIGEDGAVLARLEGRSGGELWVCGTAGLRRLIGEELGPLANFPALGADGTVVFVAGGHPYRWRAGRAERATHALGPCRGALVDGSGRVFPIASAPDTALGVFAGPDPADRLVALGDAFAGSTVVDLAANPVSVSANGRVAVRVSVADGRGFVLRFDPA